LKTFVRNRTVGLVKLRFSVACIVLVAFLFAGCKKSESAPPTVEDVSLSVPSGPTNAQPKLPTMKLFIGDEEMITEIAAQREQVETGMMFRTEMAENEGMLFVFPIPHRTAFWMKNTIVPLSAAYMDPEGVIQEIHDLQPGNTNSVIASSENIQFVLETKQGWFQRHKIEKGTLVRTEKGSLQESFLGRR
jgi:uncharacterized membrane protein (UPF0127 family)